MINLPFAPPYIDDDIINAVVDTLKSGWITTGPRSKELECELARFCDSNSVLTVNSATSGLMLALAWFGVGRGDEVIIPSYTYAATAFAVMNLGATPIMVDCKRDLCIDTTLINSLVTNRTKAIIPVDVAGLPCNYDEIKKVVESAEVIQKFHPNNHNQEKLGRLLILSDAAHSLGSSYNGAPTNLQSDISIFSFHAVKNITAAEGGAVVCNLPKVFNNSEWYNELKLLSLNGQTKDAYSKSKSGNWKYDIVCRGYKMNLPDLCSAMALAMLKKYKSELLPRRKQICENYNSLLSNFDFYELPILKDTFRESSYHFYPIILKGVTEEKRDLIISKISDLGIAVNVHYRPLPSLSFFRNQGYDVKEHPVAMSQYTREISLPVYPQLSDESVDEIVIKLNRAYEMINK